MGDANPVHSFVRDAETYITSRRQYYREDGIGYWIDRTLQFLQQVKLESDGEAKQANAPGRHQFQYPSGEAPDCAICLDTVVTAEHAEAKLMCGHIFHLSCIGSAFNSTGTMQCPTCRTMQENQPGGWKYPQAPIRFDGHYHNANVSSDPNAQPGELDFANFQRGVLQVVNSIFSGRFNLGHPFRNDEDPDDLGPISDEETYESDSYDEYDDDDNEEEEEEAEAEAEAEVEVEMEVGEEDDNVAEYEMSSDPENRAVDQDRRHRSRRGFSSSVPPSLTESDDDTDCDDDDDIPPLLSDSDSSCDYEEDTEDPGSNDSLREILLFNRSHEENEEDHSTGWVAGYMQGRARQGNLRRRSFELSSDTRRRQLENTFGDEDVNAYSTSTSNLRSLLPNFDGQSEGSDEHFGFQEGISNGFTEDHTSRIEGATICLLSDDDEIFGNQANLGQTAPHPIADIWAGESSEDHDCEMEEPAGNKRRRKSLEGRADLYYGTDEDVDHFSPASLDIEHLEARNEQILQYLRSTNVPTDILQRLRSSHSQTEPRVVPDEFSSSWNNVYDCSPSGESYDSDCLSYNPARSSPSLQDADAYLTYAAVDPDGDMDDSTEFVGLDRWKSSVKEERRPSFGAITQASSSYPSSTQSSPTLTASNSKAPARALTPISFLSGVVGSSSSTNASNAINDIGDAVRNGSGNSTRADSEGWFKKRWSWISGAQVVDELGDAGR